MVCRIAFSIRLYIRLAIEWYISCIIYFRLNLATNYRIAIYYLLILIVKYQYLLSSIYYHYVKQYNSILIIWKFNISTLIIHYWLCNIECSNLYMFVEFKTICDFVNDRNGFGYFFVLCKTLPLGSYCKSCKWN